MKKTIITLAIVAALVTTNISVYAAEIPRETTPLNSTYEHVCIVENLIGDILDEVQAGNLGYTLAAGYANTRIRKAVMANQTDGNGYGILSPIAQNAIRIMRDKQLRPVAYAQAEEELRILLADLITEVKSGKDYTQAVKEAYVSILLFCFICYRHHKKESGRIKEILKSYGMSLDEIQQLTKDNGKKSEKNKEETTILFSHTCSKCGYTFKVKYDKPTTPNKTPVLSTICPKCKSKEIIKEKNL